MRREKSAHFFVSYTSRDVHWNEWG